MIHYAEMRPILQDLGNTHMRLMQFTCKCNYEIVILEFSSHRYPWQWDSEESFKCLDY